MHEGQSKWPFKGACCSVYVRDTYIVHVVRCMNNRSALLHLLIYQEANASLCKKKKTVVICRTMIAPTIMKNITTLIVKEDSTYIGKGRNILTYNEDAL